MPCHFALVSNTSDLEYTHAVKTVLMNHLRKTTCAHLQMCPWFAHHLINGKRCLMWAGWLRYQYSLAFFASACGTISQRFQSKIRETLEAQFSIRTSRSTFSIRTSAFDLSLTAWNNGSSLQNLNRLQGSAVATKETYNNLWLCYIKMPGYMQLLFGGVKI